LPIKHGLTDRDQTAHVAADREIQSRWKEYVEDLYGKSSKPPSDEMKPVSVG